MNKMIKNAVSGALAAAAIAIAAPASAGQYVNAQLAISEVGSYTVNGVYAGNYSFDNGLSLVGSWGMDIPAVYKYFGIEVEGSKSVVDPKASQYNTLYPADVKYDYYTAGAYAVFTIPVAEKLSVRARGGLVYNHWTIKNGGYCLSGGTYYTCDITGSDVNPSVSGGVLYQFNDNLNFMADLTTFDPNNGNYHLSAGAQFRF